MRNQQLKIEKAEAEASALEVEPNVVNTNTAEYWGLATDPQFD